MPQSTPQRPQNNRKDDDFDRRLQKAGWTQVRENGAVFYTKDIPQNVIAKTRRILREDR